MTWRLVCTAMLPLTGPDDITHRRRLVTILERVQSGLIGATVSSFGITGLYITFVFGIGRFLRLSASNMRIRIPFTEMPDTSRLVALCQVRYTAARMSPAASRRLQHEAAPLLITT